MAYSTSNPPSAIGQQLTRGSSSGADGKTQLWAYESTNLTTDVVAANFFTDGWYLGMRPGDIVMGSQYTSAGSSRIAFTGIITAATTSGAQMSTASVMTSTFA